MEPRQVRTLEPAGALSEEVEDIEREQQREQYERMGLSSEVVRSLTVRGFNRA